MWILSEIIRLATAAHQKQIASPFMYQIWSQTLLLQSLFSNQAHDNILDELKDIANHAVAAHQSNSVVWGLWVDVMSIGSQDVNNFNECQSALLLQVRLI